MWITLLIILFLLTPIVVFLFNISTISCILLLIYFFIMYVVPIPTAWIWESRFLSFFQNLIQYEKIVDGDNIDGGDDSSEKRARIYAIHPHGAMNFAHMREFIFNPTRRHVWTLYASQLCIVPWMYAFLRARGNTATVDGENIRRLIVGRQSVSLCPGGIREMYLPANTIIYRTGFLKIAWTLKCDVVPFYSNENEGYRCCSFIPERWREWSMRTFGYPFFEIVIGVPWYFPLLPRCTPLLRLTQGRTISPSQFVVRKDFIAAYYCELERISQNALIVLKKNNDFDNNKSL